jgi:NDP-sugar pyrophosphorylase family protein
MQENRVTGELHPGFWMDIGTPERLDELSDWRFLIVGRVQIFRD